MWLYSVKSLSYTYISSHCPTAAAACFVGISCGRSLKLSLPAPMPIAPDDTSIISCPAFFRSLSTLQSFSMRCIFSLPVECASVEVPTFTTMRIASFSSLSSNLNRTIII